MSAQRPQCASVPRHTNRREEGEVKRKSSGESPPRWSETLLILPSSPPPLCVTATLQNKTNLSSDEVELCVALHTSRALEGGNKTGYYSKTSSWIGGISDGGGGGAL